MHPSTGHACIIIYADARVAMGDAGAGDAAFSVAADAESADV